MAKFLHYNVCQVFMAELGLEVRFSFLRDDTFRRVSRWYFFNFEK